MKKIISNVGLLNIDNSSHIVSEQIRQLHPENFDRQHPSQIDSSEPTEEQKKYSFIKITDMDFDPDKKIEPWKYPESLRIKTKKSAMLTDYFEYIDTPVRSGVNLWRFGEDSPRMIKIFLSDNNIPIKIWVIDDVGNENLIYDDKTLDFKPLTPITMQFAESQLKILQKKTKDISAEYERQKADAISQANTEFLESVMAKTYP
ncbi:MAG: hypothetical protein FWC51_03450 [Proteobacteria bacterium]|nr:hypothetical protein [Pseudomonadota bacterium]